VLTLVRRCSGVRKNQGGQGLPDGGDPLGVPLHRGVWPGGFGFLGSLADHGDAEFLLVLRQP